LGGLWLDQRCGLAQEGLGVGVGFPGVVLEQLAESVEQRAGFVGVWPRRWWVRDRNATSAIDHHG
jgi:hypothetical protein